MRSILLLLGCLLALLSSCHRFEDSPAITYSVPENFLILLVDAKHLNYDNTQTLLRTIVKHPDGSKNRDIGHAWVYLRGDINGQTVIFEGGHSGELGINQAKYFDGIMNYLEYGYANPTEWEMSHPKYEPNPVKYLWEDLNDGFLQLGPGHHKPTYAAKINLTSEQFLLLYRYITECYPYQRYNLMNNQCSSFVSQMAALAGISLDSDLTIQIAPSVRFNGIWIRLWSDSIYSHFTFSSPDMLEKSLMNAVHSGKLEYGLSLYHYLKNSGRLQRHLNLQPKNNNLSYRDW